MGERIMKCLEEECSRSGQGIATSIMHIPCSGIHCFFILLHIFSILGNVTVAFPYIWASEFSLRKITILIGLTANYYQGNLETLTKDSTQC